MKKRRESEYRLANIRWKRELKRRRRPHIKISEAQAVVPRVDQREIAIARISAHYHTVIKYKRRRALIVAPITLSLKDNADLTIGFFQSIREVAALQLPITAVSLKKVESISPTCAMLFASEMDRMKRISQGTQTIPPDSEWYPHIKKMLNQIGVFDLVEIENRPPPETDDTDEKYIMIRSGQLVDMEMAIKDLAKQVDSVGAFVKSNPHVIGAISEAMTNVRQWAYTGLPDELVPSVIRDRWWFLASYNIVKKRFSILVFDHGQGIPSTIRKFKLEVLRSILPMTSFNDADAIEAAFKVPRSATGQSNRGKGLPEMRTLLEQFSRGSLRVISGRGEYVYDCDGNVDKRLYNYDIGGTLVAWEIYEPGN